jgi:hypothetical protein
MSQVTVVCILGAVLVALGLVVWDMIEVERRGHR